MNKIIRNRHLIRFRNWSRKGYAMFASLGKCVTIGNLRKGVVDVSLGKHPHVCTLHSTSLIFLEDDSEERVADDELNLYVPSFHALLVLPQQMVEEAGEYFLSHILKFEPKRCVDAFFRLFYCIHPK